MRKNNLKVLTSLAIKIQQQSRLHVKQSPFLPICALKLSMRWELTYNIDVNKQALYSRKEWEIFQK